jgi:hypothetical protein
VFVLLNRRAKLCLRILASQLDDALKLVEDKSYALTISLGSCFSQLFQRVKRIDKQVDAVLRVLGLCGVKGDAPGVLSGIAAKLRL